MWGDAKFRALSDDAKLLWLYLLTGPETTSAPGCISVGRASLAEGLDWETDRLDRAFAELERFGMAKADWRARLVWLPNATKYITPAAWQHVRGWLPYLQILPECELKDRAIGALWRYVQTRSKEAQDVFVKAFGKPYLDRCERLSVTDPDTQSNAQSDYQSNTQWDTQSDTQSGTQSDTQSDGHADRAEEPYPIQDQDQDQEKDQDQDQTLSAIASDGPTAPEEPVPLELVPEELDPDRMTPERLVELWNEATGGRIREITPERRRRLAKAIKRESRIDWWRQCFAKAAEIKRTPDSGWLTLDWIIAHGPKGWNAERVAEGCFDFKLTQNTRAITTGYVPYGAERDAQLKEVPSGDITHLF